MKQNINIILNLKWLGSLLLSLFFIHGYSQEVPGNNKVILIGQVNNIENGAPIEHQEVKIFSDTLYNPDFSYSNTVYTDDEGFYYDTIKFAGIKGALYVKTYDYTQAVHDTTVYFRFNWTADNILFANFRLPIEPSQVSYQANFSFYVDTIEQNNYKYYFTDITNSTDVLSWQWNFGDSHYSTEQNPVHIYDTVGLFRVTLTVQIKSQVTHKPLESTIVKIIYVKNKGYYHMGGHIFADMFPTDTGQAILYKIEEDEMVAIDTAYFNQELGFYYFYQLIQGNYLVKARFLASNNLFHDTYFGNEIFWEDAEIIPHYANNFEYDIDLIPYTQNMTGPGKISGQVTFGQNGSNGKAIPAKDIEIILFDKNDITRKICHSNENGMFYLGQLDLQMFSLYAEVTGKHTFPLQVALDEHNTEINFIKITIGYYGVNGSVSSGVDDITSVNAMSQVYPNPVSSVVNFDVSFRQSKALDFDIYNSQGQRMMSGSYQGDEGSSQISVNVGNLLPGNYFILVKADDESVLVRRFIKK